MGVHGLWRLLDASGKPVPLETLEGKVLAIDVSIWIHQVLQGYQDRRGSALPNAHLLGLFHRICKLLYFKIKPVFVFDGGVPMLKKNTIASRKRQKSIAATKAQQMKNDLIQNLIKHAAVKGALGAGAGPSQGPSSSVINSNSTHDMFKLSDIPESLNSTLSDEFADDDYDDPESDVNVELSPRKQARWIGNIHNVDVTSADFKALPADVRYDVLTDLKETRKQNSWGRLHEMPDESNEFSNYQMKRLLKRRRVQESLETAEKEMGGKTLTLEELEKLLSEQGIDTSDRKDTVFRIASDSKTRIIFISDPKSLKKSVEEPSISSQSSDVQASQDSGLDDASLVTMTESVIDNINEYDLESDWDDSVDESMVPDKSIGPSPLPNKKYFGKQGLNPALAYMLEYAGLPQDQILSLIERGKKKASKNDEKAKSEEQKDRESGKETTIDLVPPEIETVDDEKLNRTISPKSSCSEDLITVPEVEDVHDSSRDVHTPENQFQKTSAPSPQVLSTESDTDSDLVEIQDVPIPETISDAKLGLEILVKSDEPLKEDEDMFADVFTRDSAEISLLGVQDVPSAGFTSTTSSFQEIVTSPKKVEESSPEKKVEESSPEKKAEEVSLISESKEPSNPEIFIETQAMVEVVEVPAESATEPIQPFRDEELRDQVEKFKPELIKANQEKLISMEAQLESEHNDLTENIGKLERQATAVTDQMRLEAQDLLRLFGIPYIVAPMEAEAQCAHLENIGLTDGTITDDSDIWLFGGRCVYKNFFNNNKRVMQFKSSDIEHHFKLSRQQMIQLALLVGSDYTVGVSGIGPVTALEILAAFPSEGDNLLRGLSSFCTWIKSGRSAGPGRASLRTKLRNVEIDKGFPSQAVVQAYLFPTVDESKEAFTWSKPNLTLLADYTRQKFGWTRLKFEEIIGPVVKKLAEAKNQKGITSYFRVETVPKSIETNMSKRVKKAVQRLAIGAIAEDEDDNLQECSSESKKQRKRRGKTTKNNEVESEGVGENAKKAVDGEVLRPTELEASKRNIAGTSGQHNGTNLNDYIPQREKDKANALKKKLRAIEVFRKSKKGPGRTKKEKRNVCNIMKEAHLSESSDSS